MHAWSALGATNYYVDYATGNNANTGKSAALPWKTLGKVQATTLTAGDSVLLKRGSVWTDSLRIRYSGSLQSPIVFTCYGEGTAPMPRISSSGVLLSVTTGSNIVIEKMSLSGGKWSGVEIADTNSGNIVIQNNEISNCGAGLYLAGKKIVVRNNYIHDGKMVVNTQGAPGTPQSNDDYGATGITFTGVNGCQVYGNRLINLVAPSYDYGTDGGALEFWKSTRHCDIYNNFAYDVDGFSEFGGQAGDSVIDVAIHHNIILEGATLADFHVSDTTHDVFAIGYDSIRMDNNLFVKRLSGPYGYFLVCGPLASANRIKIRNNIFVSDSITYYSYTGSGPRQSQSYVHVNNLLWTPNFNTFTDGWTAGSGEIYGNPLFTNSGWNATKNIDTVVAHYALQNKSPAAGSGLNLGYAIDYWENPAARGSVTDMGPIAVGSQPSSIGHPLLSTQRQFVHADFRNGKLDVSFPSEKAVHIDVRVFDARGKSVAHWTALCGSSRQSFELPSLPSGVHFLRLQADGFTPVKMILPTPVLGGFQDMPQGQEK